jgi:tetratricopeptide (TPR) repeat protein
VLTADPGDPADTEAVPVTPASTPLVSEQQLPPFSTLGIRFSKIGLIIDLLGGREALAGKTTTQVNEDHLMPLTTQSGLSLCDQLLLRPEPLSEPANSTVISEANWFISHAWSYLFLDVIEAVEVFVEREILLEERKDVVIWFDLFCSSQHSTQNRPFEWWEGIFKNAVQKLGNVMMILHPWDNPVALTRSWCVIEILAAIQTNCRFEVSMSKKESERFHTMLAEEGAVQSFHMMLSRVNSSKSGARHETDRDQIHDAVRRLLPQGFTDLDSMVLRVFEKWMQKALVAKIMVKVDSIGAEHPSALAKVNNLALLYRSQGKYEAAEPLYVRCLEDSTRILGAEHPDTLSTVNNLAALYESQGKYEVAEPLYVRCLDDSARILGADHPDTLISANNLALLYKSQGKYETAEPLYVRCLDVSTRILGAEHPSTLTSVNNLAGLYESQGKYEAAEPLYVRCLDLRTRILGPEHPDTLISVNNLALLYRSQGKYEAAEPLYIRCLDVRTRILGPEHPDTLISVNNLALLYRSQGKYEAAELLYVRCLDARTRILGAEHPDTLISVNNLAALYESRGNFEAAEPLYIRCLDVRTRTLGTEHPSILTCVNNLAGLYMSQGKYEAAEPLYVRCMDVRTRILGAEHPSTLTSVNNLAACFESVRKCKAAEALWKRLEARSHTLGAEHVVDTVE